MASWEPNPANTSCVTDADCTSISDRYNCFNSFCACVFTEQLVSSDPENGKYCDTLTAASGWSLSVRLWTLIIYFTVFVISQVISSLVPMSSLVGVLHLLFIRTSLKVIFHPMSV